MTENSFFNTDQYMPHGMCYLWNPDVLWTSVISDVVTALAYFSITIAVIVFVKKREDLMYPWFFILSGSVIFLACGTSHLISAIVIWEPIYGISAIVKAITAISSLATGIVIWFVIPFFLSLPSPSMLEIKVQKRTKELLDLESYKRKIIDSMSSVLIGVNLEGTVTQWNNAAFASTGKTAAEVKGKSLGDVFPRLAKEMDRIHQVMEQQKEQKDLKRHLSIDGELFYEDLIIYPLMEDEVEGAVVRLDDVTEQVKLEDQLRRVHKMDAVGQLTGGVAHDFNNILGIILGNLFLLEKDSSMNDACKQRVATIKKSANRANVLTKQLLSFSRKQAEDVSITNINKVIGGMDNIFARALTPEIEIKQNLSSDLWLTAIDAGDLEDALLNMVINSRDAMNNAGVLNIDTCNVMLDKLQSAKILGSSPGDYVKIAICDTGEGMTNKVLERIYEPFFTTKDQGKGTGLGMAMVFGFIKRTKGCIHIISTLGEGTTIELYLPRVEGEIHTDKDVKNVSDYKPKTDIKILIVEDEHELLMVAMEYLEEIGYNVITANNAHEALQKLQEHQDVQILFSDIVMPGGMNGYELVKEVTSISPEIKILLTSGYSSNSEVNVASEKLISNLLIKPYSLAVLAHKLQDLMHQD